MEQLNIYKKYAGAQILIEGTIDDDPVYGARGDHYHLHGMAQSAMTFASHL